MAFRENASFASAVRSTSKESLWVPAHTGRLSWCWKVRLPNVLFSSLLGRCSNEADHVKKFIEGENETVGSEGFEPPTARASAVYSPGLSYEPVVTRNICFSYGICFSPIPICF